MNIQTSFCLLLPFTVFSIVGVLTTLLFDDTTGLYSLIFGWVVGLLLAEWHIPSLIRHWERTGIPGDLKTLEQQKQWDQEKGKRQRKQNLAVLIGLIGAAVLRIYFKEVMPLFIPAILGAAATYFLRIGWLIYRKRGKLGP